MKSLYDLFLVEGFLLVLGEEYRSQDFPYIVAEKVSINGKFMLWQVDNENDWDSGQFEILAHAPVWGKDPIPGIPLLPPIEKDFFSYTEDELRGAFQCGQQWSHDMEHENGEPENLNDFLKKLQEKKLPVQFKWDIHHWVNPEYHEEFRKIRTPDGKILWAGEYVSKDSYIY